MFVVLTTSALPWKDLVTEYRAKGEVEYDFSRQQSDPILGIMSRFVQESTESKSFFNSLSLRLKLMLLELMKGIGLNDECRSPN